MSNFESLFELQNRVTKQTNTYFKKTYIFLVPRILNNLPHLDRDIGFLVIQLLLLQQFNISSVVLLIYIYKSLILLWYNYVQNVFIIIL